eukprot:gene22700-30982_t
MLPRQNNSFRPSSTKVSNFTVDCDRTVHIYTDGSCIGNQNVKVSFCPAGWGVVIATRAAENWKILEELYGPVVLEKTSPYFLGATVGSNNTGELSAIGEALLWLENNNDPAEYPAAVIHYDSEYAAKSVTGEFNGPKNRTLYLNIRDIFHRLTVNPERMRIAFEHVKGHSNDRWNDRADKLANKGSSGMTCSAGRYGSRKAEFAAKESCDSSIGSSRKGSSALQDDSPNKKVKVR